MNRRLRLITVALLLGISPGPASAIQSCGQQGLDAFRAELQSASFGARGLALRAAFGAALADHAVPFANPLIVQRLADPLARDMESLPLLPSHSVTAEIAALRQHAGWASDPLSLVPPASDGGGGVQRLSRLLDAVDALLDRAFAGVAAADRQAVSEGLPRWLDGTANELAEDGLAEPLLRTAAAVDQAALQQALALLLSIASPSGIDSLRRDLAQLAPIARPAWLSVSFQGELLYARQTPQGPILVGAAGPNQYAAPARLVVDVGGDDLYAAPMTLVMDLDGDDHYLASQDAATAAGLFGAGMVLDVAGDDVYSGGRIAQGAAVFGVGVLWDVAGNDHYLAQELAQGAALFGAGLLVDLDGDDHYSAAKFAQGFGGPGSQGGLIDVAGRDHYLAGAKHPSSYATPGSYQAFSQGVGMGLRGHAAGGLGVLSDHAGDDRYLGGNFSQGIGYYLGMGVLQDGAGNDHYLGSRYAQGAAAHLGIGLLVDRQGDDRYQAKTAANQGAGWDLSIAALIDCAGDDHYGGGELALAAGEQNGVAWFYDGGGVDRYAARAKAFGFAGEASYGGGRGAGNIALFIDAGGDVDHYPLDAAVRDGVAGQSGDLGRFVDR